MDDANKHFQEILNAFTSAVEAGDGRSLAELFTEDGTYEDEFYGAFSGREAIRSMIEDYFWKHAKGFRWKMLEPVVGHGIGYARYQFSYESTIPESLGRRVRFDGMSQFTFQGKLISRYREIFNTGMALVQLGFPANRLVRHLEKRTSNLDFE